MIDDLIFHLRAALADLGVDRGVPTIEHTGQAWKLTYPTGETTEWAADPLMLRNAVEGELTAALELCMIIAHRD